MRTDEARLFSCYQAWRSAPIPERANGLRGSNSAAGARGSSPSYLVGWTSGAGNGDSWLPSSRTVVPCRYSPKVLSRLVSSTFARDSAQRGL